MPEAFDLVEPRPPEGLAVYLRARQSPWLFRVAPARDPAQPRLWCLRVDRCTRTGPITAGNHAKLFVGARGMTRDQLMTALGELRANPGSWLGQGSQRDLRRWLLEANAAPFEAPVPAVTRLTGTNGAAPATKSVLTEAAERH